MLCGASVRRRRVELRVAQLLVTCEPPLTMSPVRSASAFAVMVEPPLAAPLMKSAVMEICEPARTSRSARCAVAVTIEPPLASR